MVPMANLKAEMVRKNVTVRDVARVLGVSERTAANKLSGRGQFRSSEMFRLQRVLFPERFIHYLFGGSTL